jgi:hypothetical protein
MYLQEIGWGWEDVDWIHLARNREGQVAGSFEHGNELVLHNMRENKIN